MTDRSFRAAGIAYVVASATAFGAMAIFARYAYADGVDTATLLALRFVIAGAFLIGTCAIAGVAWPRGRDLATLVALGAVGYAAQAASFFTALTLAPAGLVALLLYVNPAIVALLAGVARARPARAAHARRARHRADRHGAHGRPGARRRPGGHAPGGRRARRAGGPRLRGLHRRVDRRRRSRRPARDVDRRDRERRRPVRRARPGARSEPFRRPPPGGRRSWRSRWCRRVAAITWFFAGLKRIGPTRASTLSTVEPAVTVALAAIFLGERIAPMQMAGGALILAAVVLLARAGAQDARGTKR